MSAPPLDAAPVDTLASVAVLIERHEGRVARPYRDSVGKLTIGVGHCLDAKPLPDAIITALRDADIADARAACAAIFGTDFAGFAPVRQAALIDMAFTLGEAGLRGFGGLRSAIARGDWTNAAACALQSKWAEQAPRRARTDAQMLATAAWPTAD